jgi:hypothetical protein
MRSNGPGRYDAECTVARESTNAQAVILIVVGGDKGEGFQVQSVSPAIMMRLPGMLEDIARMIRAQITDA